MEPMTMAAVGMQLVGGVGGAKSARAEGKTQAAINQYNAHILLRNKQLFAQQAGHVKDVAAREDLRFKEDVGRVFDTAAVAFRRNGVQISGSAWKALMEGAREADETSALNLQTAAVKSAAILERGTEAGLGAALEGLYSDAARQTGRNKALASLIGGAKSAALTYMSA